MHLHSSTGVGVDCLVSFFLLMLRRPTRSNRTDTLFPDTTLFRSPLGAVENSEGHGEAALNLAREALAERIATWGPDDPRVGTGYNDVASARSEEHTSELQSLMSISYADFCLNKKTTSYNSTNHSLCIHAINTESQKATLNSA